jgi:hypothetical protein
MSIESEVEEEAQPARYKLTDDQAWQIRVQLPPSNTVHVEWYNLRPGRACFFFWSTGRAHQSPISSHTHAFKQPNLLPLDSRNVIDSGSFFFHRQLYQFLPMNQVTMCLPTEQPARTSQIKSIGFTVHALSVLSFTSIVQPSELSVYGSTTGWPTVSNVKLNPQPDVSGCSGAAASMFLNKKVLPPTNQCSYFC